jgi:hypothetical protein
MSPSSKDAQCIWMLYEQQAAPMATPQATPQAAPMAAPQQPAAPAAAPQQPQPNATNPPAFALRTFGDLKAIINRIKNKQRTGNVVAAATDVAIDGIIGLIPGLSTAKTAFDFFKKATARPDTQKTNSFIDLLDVDDSMSKIVDDAEENGFLQSIEAIISKKPDKESLPPNWNMTNELINYLRDKYKISPAVLRHLQTMQANAAAPNTAAPLR